MPGWPRTQRQSTMRRSWIPGADEREQLVRAWISGRSHRHRARIPALTDGAGRHPGSFRKSRVSVTCSRSRVGHAPDRGRRRTTRSQRPGQASRIGECVAMTIWQPALTASPTSGRKRQLAERRQGRLGLVEEVRPAGHEPVAEERQERLAVRLGVDAAAVAPLELGELLAVRAGGEVAGERLAIGVVDEDLRRGRLRARPASSPSAGRSRRSPRLAGRSRGACGSPTTGGGRAARAADAGQRWRHRPRRRCRRSWPWRRWRAPREGWTCPTRSRRRRSSPGGRGRGPAASRSPGCRMGTPGDRPCRHATSRGGATGRCGSGGSCVHRRGCRPRPLRAGVARGRAVRTFWYPLDRRRDGALVDGP